jgi:hypothetical protein
MSDRMSARGVRGFKKRNKGKPAVYVYFLTKDGGTIELETPLPSAVFEEIVTKVFLASDFGEEARKLVEASKGKMPLRYAALLADELSPRGLDNEGDQSDGQPEGDEHEDGVTS